MSEPRSIVVDETRHWDESAPCHGKVLEGCGVVTNFPGKHCGGETHPKRMAPPSSSGDKSDDGMVPVASVPPGINVQATIVKDPPGQQPPQQPTFMEGLKVATNQPPLSLSLSLSFFLIPLHCPGVTRP